VINRIETAFDEMFRGWDRVVSWRDPGTDLWNVRLQLDMLRVHEDRNPAELANALWPKQPHMRPLRGIRFNPGRARWRLK
jgi:hypothetical protein